MDEESPALAQIVAKIAESFSMDARTAAASAVQYDDGDGDRMTLSSGANSAADVNIMLKELVSERDAVYLSNALSILTLWRFQQPPYKLHVMLPEAAAAVAATVADSFKGEEHAGVHCASCHRNVVGFRYKCLVCSDYDICARYATSVACCRGRSCQVPDSLCRCEANATHPSHDMIRICLPRQYPAHFFTRIHR